MTGKVLAPVLAIGVLAAGAAPAGAARRSDASNASLGPLVCRPATDPRDREIEITATMRPLADTARMAMRFKLLERIPGFDFDPVHGGDLGRWLPEPPAPGQQPVTAWIVRKPVVNLYAPADYRFRVTFRWTAQSGVTTSTSEVSRVCVQPRFAAGRG